ncbi:hypothetical protein L6R52_16405 [Myxococcota bacterium]|nr:hypothetical protein [Myxococcota bacterium]
MTKQLLAPSLLRALERRSPPPFIPAPFRTPHLAVKLFFAPGSRVDLAIGAKAFERWLRERAISSGQLIEVVTRTAKDGGPSVMLLGVQTSWRIDVRNGRPGLVYTRRGRGSTMRSARDVLFTVFLSAIEAARLLEVDADVRFSTDVFELELVETERELHDDELRAARQAVERELGLFALEIFEGPELDTTHPAPQLFRVVVYPGRRRTLGELIARMHAVA